MNKGGALQATVNPSVQITRVEDCQEITELHNFTPAEANHGPQTQVKFNGDQALKVQLRRNSME